MKRKTIHELKDLFEHEKITDSTLQKLKKDSRKGVQQLIKTYENKKLAESKLYEQFKAMCHYERKSIAKGHKYVAGVDEAGRGPLAGPVVAAAVILPNDFELIGLTDSKQLNEKTRNHFFEIIKERAVSYGVSIINNEIIDDINIYEATKQAMVECLQKLKQKPNHVLIDAVPIENLPYTSDVIIKGDQKSISIAAASVIAKVTRDKYMQQLHTEYPMYEFISNMGYGTKQHVNMLKKYGVTPYHRQSFAPVKNLVNQ